MTLAATSTAHPFKLGQRVRHDGRKFSTEPHATVLEVRPQRDGTFEYRVWIDEGGDWVGLPTPREAWWASYHTYGLALEDDPRPISERFATPDGFFINPESAAAHVFLVQGGFTTAEIEADRMLKAGGVQAERAQAWLDARKDQT